MPRRQRLDSAETIFGARAIPSFRQTVRIEEQRITVSQSEPMDREARVTKHSQRYSCGIFWRHSVTVDVKHGKVTRVDKLHGAIVGNSSHNESCELSRESA